MKYKISVIIVCMAVIALLPSCTDLLEKKPLDKISSEDVWNNKGLIDSYMVDLYARIVGGYLTFTSTRDDQMSDNLVSDAHGLNIVYETISNTYDAGFNKYQDIVRINTAIEGLENSTLLQPEIQSELLAEAKMFRAVVYHWMVRRFGGVMKVDRVLSPMDDMKLSRTPEEEMYDFIVSDMEYAKENMTTENVTGKLNKAAAHAFLIRVLLDARRYDDVIREAEDFLKSKGAYGAAIDSDYKGIFNDFNGVNSKEVLFVRYADNSGLTMVGTPLQWTLPLSNKERTESFCDWSNIKTSMYGWAQFFPTQQLIDSYEVIDNDGKAKNWWETDRWKNRQKGENVTDIMWENRDKRFYASIMYDGCSYAGDKYIMRYPYFPYRGSMATRQHYAMSGYLIRKGCPENMTSFSSTSTPVDYHWVILRLGEVYLNYAEALIRKGRNAEALPYLNELREKHGELPPITDSSDLLDKYKRERRVEMFHEQDRYWSLLRWGKEEGWNEIKELNENPRYIDISPDGSTYYIATVNGVFVQDLPQDYAGNNDYFENPANYGNPAASKIYNGGTAIPDRRFTVKRYYFPIPKSQIEANPNLVQNDGWN